MHTPTGYVFMNTRGPGQSWMVDHSRKANILTHTFLDMNRQAGDFQRATGCPYVMSRIYPFEPHPNTQDFGKIKEYAAARLQDLYNLSDDAQNPNVHFIINNEQGFRRDDFIMYAEMIEEMVRRGRIIGLCFWNGASGSVTTGFWDQPNQWDQGWVLDFIKVFHRHRNLRLPSGAYALVLGVHSYTSQYPLIAVNAGQHRLGTPGYDNLWQLHAAYLEGVFHIDWRLAQDHMARNYQGIMKALKWVPTSNGRAWEPGPDVVRDENANPVEPPWILNTEAGFDNMNDVRSVHWNDLVIMDTKDAKSIPEELRDSWEYALSLGLSPDTLQVRELIKEDELKMIAAQAGRTLDTPRGYRSLEQTWQQPKWFPGESLGEVFAYCMDWKHRMLYSRTGYHIGSHNYCLGDTSGPNFWWLSFNLWDTGEGRAKQQDYFNALESGQHKVDVPAHFIGAVTIPVPEPPVVVDPKPPPTPPTPPDAVFAVIRPAGDYTVNVRKTPSIQAPILTKITPPLGTTLWFAQHLTIPDGPNQWYHITLPDNIAGWVRSDVVEVFQPEKIKTVRQELTEALIGIQTSVASLADTLQDAIDTVKV